MCSKGASGDRAAMCASTRSLSMPRPTRIFGRNGSTATPEISFALQTEITSRLANALGAELIAVEAARPTDNPDARDYILRGRAATLKPTSRDSYAELI